jgi:drug/metabolite transporter (DMT)-like permease
VTMIVAAILLSEAVTLAAAAGGAITIAGIYLVNRP